MSAVPTSVGVFFGQVDKRPKGWYWTDTKSEKSKQAIRGPFETKEQAVEDALHSLASDRKGCCVSISDGDGGRVVTIQSLSDAQLIKILQLDDCDDELTQMVEEALTRRKWGGACQ